MSAAPEHLKVVQGQRLRPVLELVATSLEHPRFDAAATAVLAQLATWLGCNSASLGIVEGQHCRVLAVSHSAALDARMNLARAAGAAMEEALDQGTSIVYPPQPGPAVAQVTHAHAQFAREAQAGSVCTLPVNRDGELVGCVLLEHAGVSAFSPDTVALCEAVVALVGPILHAKLDDERPLLARAGAGLRAAAGRLFGSERLSVKLGVAAVAAAVVALAFITGDYRVSATATLEGSVQRAVLAPLDGFIESAKVRPGDVVAAGDLLCELDDDDLKLERARWYSEQQKIAKAYRSALVQQDRTEVMIEKARLEQAEAKLALAEQQLARSRIVAPIDGVIVAGDLSQSLGAPVVRGEVLFEVAPLDNYRVMLQIDERDIGQIAEGQRGTLALAGFPDKRFAFEIERITPVSTAADGRNHFIVEAALAEPDALLRPGMQGVAKVQVGERRLGWILTHKLTDWLRLKLWV